MNELSVYSCQMTTRSKVKDWQEQKSNDRALFPLILKSIVGMISMACAQYGPVKPRADVSQSKANCQTQYPCYLPNLAGWALW